MLVYHVRVLRLVVGLAMLAGCDTVFGLTRDDDAPHDAPTGDALDAPTDAVLAEPCAGRATPPQFCFDFDDVTFIGYQRGNSFPIVAVQSGVEIDRRAPAHSAPAALWFDAVAAGAATVARTDASQSFHGLTASMWLRGTTTGTVQHTVSVFLLSVEDASRCRGELSVDTLSLEMTYTIACGNSESSSPAGVLTDAWQPVSMSFDRASGTGRVSVGTTVSSQIQIAGTVGTEAPTITFGIVSTQEPGLRIGFDDITVVGD